MKRRKNINQIVLLISLALSTILMNGCDSFDEINTNPDAPTTVTSQMLATKLILDHVRGANSDNSEFFMKRMFWGEQMLDIQYNRITNGGFGGIQGLTNAQKMVELASDVDKDAFTGLFYYMKGWTFYRATMDMGDIPYSQALQVNEYTYPAYDEQKDVFKGILEDLAKADEYFSKTTRTFPGDPFLKGKPEAWRKATNVLRLKVLLSLSKRAEDTPELKVKETFAQIVNAGNIFQSNADNLQVTYSNKDGQMNPWRRESTKSIEVFAGTETLINPLKQFKDYRLFYYFEPAQGLTDPLYLIDGETLLERNDWNAYPAINAAGAFSVEQAKISGKRACRPNDIYRNSPIGVPSIRLGYADMNFILAEAAERGWISGSAQSFYEEGIKASFEFVRTTVPNEDVYTKGMAITDSYINEYLKGEGVDYAKASSFDERLKLIRLQAYIASFFHLSYDSYYDYRRTGYPEMPINPETNLNDAKDRIPVRWLYPTSETNYNKESLMEAVQRQWGGAEDVNKIMWVLK